MMVRSTTKTLSLRLMLLVCLISRVNSQCVDSVQNTYGRMLESCNNIEVRRHLLTESSVHGKSPNYNVSVTSKFLPIYLVAVEIDLSEFEGIISEQGIIILQYDQQVQNITFSTVTTKKILLQLTDPLVIKKGNTEVQMTLLKDNAGNGLLLDPTVITFLLLPPFDFCKDIQCLKLYDEYDSSIRNSTACNHEDNMLFKYKYGYCKDHKLPIVLKSSFDLQVPLLKEIEISNGDYIEKLPNFVYRLTKVDGPTGNNKTIILPKECVTNILPSSQDNYFCTNEITGSIYTTGAIETVNLKLGDTYNITIEITHVGFPYRKFSIILALNMSSEDVCSKVWEIYEQLKSTCLQHVVTKRSSSISSSSINFIFVEEPLKSVLGFRVSSRLISNIDNLEVHISINGNETKLFYTIDRFVGQTFHYLSFPMLSYETKKHQIDINVFLYNNSNPISFDPNLVDSPLLYYIHSWHGCADSNCINLYKQWNATKPNNIRCKEDPLFAHVHYGICLDLRPVFTKGLSIVEKNFIGGCTYRSPVDLVKHAYLLLNNQTRIPLSRNGFEEEPPIMEEHDFPMLFEVTKYELVGTYQCVLYDKDRMRRPVVSKPFIFEAAAPSFVRSLNTSVHNADIGVNYTIPGCRFSSRFPLSSQQISWWKNGEFFKEAKMNAPDSFQDLLLSSITLRDSGFYQCAIFIQNYTEKPILSGEIELTVAELQVNISGSPNVLKKRNEFGGLVYEIGGCRYSARINLNHALFLYLDNETRLNVNGFVEKGEFFFSDYIIKSYNETGTYRCGIFDPNFMKKLILSEDHVNLAFAEPSFISNPQINSPDVTAGDKLIIFGCVYRANFKLNPEEVFWLVEHAGKTKIIPSSSFVMSVEGEENCCSMNRIVKESTLSDIGSYSCGLRVKGMSTPVKSAPVMLNIKALQPKFINEPKFYKNIDVQFVVSDCRYSTNSRVSASYLVFNNSKKINVDSEPLSKFSGEYAFMEYVIDRYEMQGTYHCEVFDEDKMIQPVRSQTIQVFLPAPSFTKAPSVGETEFLLSSLLLIEGCKYSSPVRLELEFYWLQNGYLKIASDQTSDFESFPDLSIKNANVKDQGYYQCVIYVPYLNQEVKSERIDVKFQGVFSTWINIKLDQTWNVNLKNGSSPQYIALKNGVESQLKKSLSVTDGINRDPFVEVLRFTKGSVNAITRIMFSGLTKKDQLAYCNSFKNFQVGSSSSFPVLSVLQKSQDCCHEDVSGDVAYKGVYYYNTTLANDVVIKPCLYQNTFGKMKSFRECLMDLKTGARWNPVNLSRCLPLSQATQDLEALDQVSVCKGPLQNNCGTVNQIAANLSSIISNSSQITVPQDLNHIANIITDINAGIDNSTNVPQVVTNIFESVDKVIAANLSILASAQITYQSSTRILKDIESLGNLIRNYVKEGTKLQIKKTNIAFTAAYVDQKKLWIYTLPPENGTYTVFMTNNELSLPLNVVASIELPREAFSIDNNFIHSTFFKKGSLFQSEQTLLFNTRDAQDPGQLVQSTVLSAAVGNVTIRNLSSPVVLKFSRSYYTDLTGIDVCSFWKFTENNIGGHWSSSGCQKMNDEDSHAVICHCDHLTNFAILLDTTQSGYNPIELQIVTWIGCGISLAALLLTIITFTAFKNLRKKLPPKILLCLCISLMLLLIVFLVGVEKTSSETACKIIAALLQYFMLSTFLWMTVEGINLYRCFVKVFKSGGEKKFMIRASIFAWGLPAVIVIITAGIKPDNLGNDDFCVIHGYPFYFGVLLPVAIIIAGNFIVLVLVLRGISHSRSIANQDKNAKQRLLGQARVAFACSILLGVTWVFGLLAVGKATKFFQWLFCIFNSMQGFFIFIFYTVRNTDARKEWKGCLGISDDDRNMSSTGARHGYELKSTEVGSSTT